MDPSTHDGEPMLTANNCDTLKEAFAFLLEVTK